MMNIFPKKAQWNKWTLPSKAGYIGAWIAFISFILFIFYPKPSDMNQNNMGNYNFQSKTEGEHSPIYNAENINIYSEPEAVKDIENSIQKTSKADEENIKISVYDNKTGKMKEVTLLEGKIYTSYTRKGAQLDYMLKNDKIYVEYTSPRKSWTAYYVTDFEGNILDSKFPYNLEEYTVEIPEGLELRRKEEHLTNGWKHIHIDLKWDKSIDLVYDKDTKLKQFSINGGVQIRHEDKRIVVLDPK